MLDWSTPLALLGLGLIPLIRWLHRFRPAETVLPVSALFLWRNLEQPGSQLRRGPLIDSRWRRRALLVALLTLAAGGPRWLSYRPQLMVWFDDTPSMQTTEGGRHRMDLGALALLAALDEVHRTRVLVRSLTDPRRALELRQGDEDGLAEALNSWAREGARQTGAPMLGPPPPGYEHWLVSDGADPAVVAWAERFPFARSITVGSETENTAVTSVSLRRQPAAAGGASGLVQLHHLGLQPTERTLRVTDDAGRVLFSEQVLLRPATRQDISFRFDPATTPRLTAQLVPADALPLDDSLTVETAPLAPLDIGIAGHCAKDLLAALVAHPGLRVGDAPALVVICSEVPTGGDGPQLWFPESVRNPPLEEDPFWLPEAGSLQDLSLSPAQIRPADPPPGAGGPGQVLLRAGDRDLILSLPTGDGTRRIYSWFDPGAPLLVQAPVYPQLVAGLVEVAAGRPLLDPTASARRDPDRSRIAPGNLPPSRSPGLAGSSESTIDLALLPLGLACFVLLWDLFRSSGRIPAIARVAVLLVLLVGLWGPGRRGEPTPVDLVLLVDVSSSTRAGEADLRRAVEGALSALDAGDRTAVVGFAADASLELPFTDAQSAAEVAADIVAAARRRHAVTRPTTDLDRALIAGLGLAGVKHPLRFLLASDDAALAPAGLETARRLRQLGVPLIITRLPGPGRAGDAWIREARVPPQALQGRREVVSAVVEGTVDSFGELIFSVGGERMESRRVHLHPGVPLASRWQFTARSGGPLEVELELQLNGDPEPGNNRWAQVVEVLGLSRVLYIARGPVPPPVATSLKAGGWPVVLAPPQALKQQLEAYPPPDLVVLDDIAAWDAEADTWLTLETQVRTHGTGLVVLGGPHSFHRGGYRDSVLEGLLPVVVRDQDEPAEIAVLFLLDTSGSMGGGRLALDPLELATASLRSAAALLPIGALTGLIAFDVTPREILPLAAHRNPLLPFAQTPARTPAGGTLLGPALELALDRLRARTTGRRVAVVLTDGQLGDAAGDLAELRERLAGERVEVIPILIGRAAPSPVLRDLAVAGGTGLLRAAKTTEVPDLLADHLLDHQAGDLTHEVRSSLPLPFLPVPVQWPPVVDFANCRPRPAATVYLTDEGGTPLLSVHRAGSGRVAALSAGLGPWAPKWGQHPRWGELVGGLSEWVSPSSGDRFLEVALSQAPAGLAVRAEALTPEGDWWSRGIGKLAVYPRDGSTAELEVLPVAPGRYLGEWPGAVPGRYGATFALGDRTVRRQFRIEERPEFLPLPGGAGWMTSCVEQGLASLWSPGEPLPLDRERGPQRSARPALAALGGLAFLALLLWELLVSPPARSATD